MRLDAFTFGHAGASLRLGIDRLIRQVAQLGPREAAVRFGQLAELEDAGSYARQVLQEKQVVHGEELLVGHAVSGGRGQEPLDIFPFVLDVLPRARFSANRPSLMAFINLAGQHIRI